MSRAFIDAVRSARSLSLSSLIVVPLPPSLPVGLLRRRSLVHCGRRAARLPVAVPDSPVAVLDSPLSGGCAGSGTDFSLHSLRSTVGRLGWGPAAATARLSGRAPPRRPLAGTAPAAPQRRRRRRDGSTRRRPTRSPRRPVPPPTAPRRSRSNPATTSVISPRRPSAATSRSWASVPRWTSSKVLVSSRHRAALRSGPNASTMAAMVSVIRCTASKNTIVRGSVGQPGQRPGALPRFSRVESLRR